MQQRFSLPLATATGKPVSTCRLILRFLREAGMVPGASVRPTPRHIARIILALAADSASGCPASVAALAGQPLTSAADLPGTLEDTLTRIIDTLPDGPVVGDLDLDDGNIFFGETWARVEALDLGGKRAVVTFGHRPAGICNETIIPILSVRQIADAITRTRP